MESALVSCAQELIRRMDSRTGPIDAAADLAELDEVLEAAGAGLSDGLVAALMNTKARTYIAARRPEDALSVHEELVERFERSVDPAAVHDVDLALRDAADLLLVSLDRREEGVALAERLLSRFEQAPEDRYLPYKGFMLVEPVFVMFACECVQEVLGICEMVKRRLSGRNAMSQSVVAEALFYEIHALVRLRPDESVAGLTDQLTDTGEPGLASLGRLAKKFDEEQSNAIWRTQIDMTRVSILVKLDRLGDARRLHGALRRRAAATGVPADMLIELDAFDLHFNDA